MTTMPAALRARVDAACVGAAARQHPAPPVPQPRGGDGASTESKIRRAELLEGIALGEARAKLRAMPQVTAFPQLLQSTDKDQLRKAADLAEYIGRQPRMREILAEPGERMKKLGLETGYDTRYDVFRFVPLEPWTGPDGSMRTYQRIMLADDGATTIGDYSGADLDKLEWMRDEELVSIGDDGRIHALSDSRAKKVRKYPGAAVPDERAGIGSQLRDLARGLVLAAITNLSAGRPVRRRKRQGLTAEGIKITGEQVAAEVNAIKAKRPELAGYRWLSLSTARGIIRELIGCGLLEELSPPKPVRQQRSWRTMPRVIRRLTTDRFKPSPPEET